MMLIPYKQFRRYNNKKFTNTHTIAGGRRAIDLACENINVEFVIKPDHKNQL